MSAVKRAAEEAEALVTLNPLRIALLADYWRRK